MSGVPELSAAVREELLALGTATTYEACPSCRLPRCTAGRPAFTSGDVVVADARSCLIR